ncbi:MAG: Rne/Rng family ribonuclease [Deltaproteobacteria bacterium]|nr:Rne/Rng family ribonuclease [Deltaproteobacteria bacterium]
MLINVTHAEESRVGIVDDGQLESFEIESFSREHLKGNIYKGVVRRIHPAIEAAFVDIGADRDAFLPLDEICFRNLPGGRNGGASQERGEKGRRRIKEVLKSGDEILVQIVKEQFTNKPPTLSTFYSLPGRYLVLLPGSEDAGISRKIEGEERVRVREMIESLHPPAGCGIIVRTAAGFDDEHRELERDLAYLARLWESIKQNAETKRGPALIYREHDLVLRNIRDYFTPDIDEVFIDNEDVHERAKDFLHNIMPGKEHLLHLYQGDQPIFSRFGLEAQIESIYKRRVALKSGGSIVIDGTEALTAIDVNSGGSMRGTTQEETAHKTNLEAAREVARQLRLRDLGGIIVVDFIDMRVQSHIVDVERALREAMRPEKARHDVGRISKLGLLEISRQRLRPAAVASSYTACPMCEGHGSIRTPESAALGTLRKIHHRVAEGDVAQMNVTLPRDVAMYLLNQKRDDLATLERRYSARINIVISDKLMPHQSEIETRIREVTAPVAVLRPGEVASADRTPNGLAASARGGGRRPTAAGVGYGRGPALPLREGEDEASQRRRRRGGRSRRGEDAEAVRPAAEAPTVTAAPSTGAPLSEHAPESAGSATRAGESAPATSEAAVAAEATVASLTAEPEGIAPPPSPVDRTGEILAAANGSWIEAIPPFMPAEAVAPGADVADPNRRRRRRGGRRGGRGRRPGPGGAPERGSDAGDPPPAGAALAPTDEGGTSTGGSEGPAADVQRTGSRRRRRRGGSGRRRTMHEGRAGDGPEGTPTAAVTAPAEPSRDS